MSYGIELSWYPVLFGFGSGASNSLWTMLCRSANIFLITPIPSVRRIHIILQWRVLSESVGGGKQQQHFCVLCVRDHGLFRGPSVRRDRPPSKQVDEWTNECEFCAVFCVRCLDALFQDSPHFNAVMMDIFYIKLHYLAPHWIKFVALSLSLSLPVFLSSWGGQARRDMHQTLIKESASW